MPPLASLLTPISNVRKLRGSAAGNETGSAWLLLLRGGAIPFWFCNNTAQLLLLVAELIHLGTG